MRSGWDGEEGEGDDPCSPRMYISTSPVRVDVDTYTHTRAPARSPSALSLTEMSTRTFTHSDGHTQNEYACAHLQQNLNFLLVFQCLLAAYGC